MDLTDLWFVILAFLWTGYLILEGFDFGVGMLLPWVGRDDRERSVMLSTIGPFWDGNEVWLVVAGAGTFAAFPGWYASMFSGFYLALLLLLVLLIIRVVSFEWRERSEAPRWRGLWTWCNTVAGFGVPLIWGIAFADLVGGVPLDPAGDFTGTFLDLFSAYSVLGGLGLASVCAFNGAVYLALRTEGPLRRRSLHAARRTGPVAVVLAAGFLAWTVVEAVQGNDRPVWAPLIPALIAAAALVGAVALAHRGREGWAFTATAVAITGTVATIFAGLYPRVMVSDPDFQNSLTLAGTSSSHYTLAVMTVVALVLTPIVVLYQAWSYRVLRGRLGLSEPVTNPIDALMPPAAPGTGPGTDTSPPGPGDGTG